MRTLVFVALLWIHSVAAGLHSMKYFYTSSSGIPNFPEFVGVGLVDEVQMVHYDSNTGRAEPKQDWMSKVTADDPQYWETQTQNFLNTQQVSKANIDTAKQRFNQTGGVHIAQTMYGCEWDDETGEINGYSQDGYDGEDFIAFDLKTETWIAPNQQALITKQKWGNNKALNTQRKQYLTQICPEWVKKYENYGRSSLLRTELPSVSLLQKSPDSPVSCHATGFYPKKATMFWRKNGEELHEGVDVGETLPNHDGTFQMSVDLRRSDAADGPEKYECVFQLSGDKDVVTRLEKAAIRSNNKKFDTTIIIIVAVVALAVVLLAAVAFMAYKKKKAKCPLPQIKTPLDPSQTTWMSSSEIKTPLDPSQTTRMSSSGSETSSSDSISSTDSQDSDKPLLKSMRES